jgi:hypothetical protein
MSLRQRVADRLAGRALSPLEKGRSDRRKRVDARLRRAMAIRVGIEGPAFDENDSHPNPPLFKGREHAADAAPPHAIVPGMMAGGSA